MLLSMQEITNTTAKVAETITPEKLFDQIKTLSLTDLGEKAISWAVSFGGRLLAAIVVFIVFRWIIKRIRRRLKMRMEKKENSALIPFTVNLVSISLNILMIFVVIWILGIETSSFIALFASAGIAIGMALSGTLQNFAGGVMILVFKPFQIGDFIDAQGKAGTVKAILITNTVILTPDNQTIYIPNGSLSTGIITNYSAQDFRRVDWTFSIAYGDDYQEARSVLEELIGKEKRILNEPAAPFIALNKMADSSIDIVVRAWVNKADYWDVYFLMNETVYKTFEEKGLSIPFPQVDVHIKQ
ncbi:MAG: mechanosensitive ion channel [Bacteroidales bacterium]|jgi:small conductance mechanosensitive channel|nr:mechanosensitive ion channel [Bacteroidales bacterium]